MIMTSSGSACSTHVSVRWRQQTTLPPSDGPEGVGSFDSVEHIQAGGRAACMHVQVQVQVPSTKSDAIAAPPISMQPSITTSRYVCTRGYSSVAVATCASSGT